MRTIRKRVKQVAIAAGISLAAFASVVAAPPAAALEGEPIVYDARPGSVFKKDYTVPMAGNDPAGLFHVPGDCAVAPSCTEIPLKIQLPPDFDPETDDFSIIITLTWNLAGSPDDNAVNDLDMYIYDMNRVNEETGEEEPGVAAQSATASMPEIAKMFAPPADHDYRILVSNYVGPNSGFTLELTYKDFSFEPPDEGEPVGVGPTDEGGGDDIVVEDEPAASDDGASDDLGDSVIAAPPIGAGESPALVVPDGDDDFSDGFSVPTGGAASGRAPSLFADDAAAVEAGPVAGGVLAAWLGVAPLALLASVIAFILKRRPPALSMAFPTGAVRVDHPADA